MLLKSNSRLLPARLLLGLALAGLCIPQTATQLVTPDIRRVGDKLACKCGACNNTVATCQMLECHYSLPARERIAQMQKTGASDDNIVSAFVKESGIAALAAPPAEGFNLLAWIMPFVGVTLGLMGVLIWFKRMRPSTVSGPAELPEIDPKYQQRIDRDLEELE
jgi:cytochrome c-type biogenesis protein CcmH/NrfF